MIQGTRSAPDRKLSLLELEQAWGGVGHLPLKFSLRVLLEVMSQLHHWHQRGKLHGELTPQHILLTEGSSVQLLPPRGLPRRPGEPVAAPPLYYLAPEKLRRAKLDARADVFSAGVLLWQALAGKPLLEATAAGDILARWSSAGAPLAEVRSPLLWARSLSHIAARALAVEPAERYSSIEQMLSAVELLAGRHAEKPESWNTLLRARPLTATRSAAAGARAQGSFEISELPDLSVREPDDSDTVFDLNAVPSDFDSDSALRRLDAHFGYEPPADDELPTRFMDARAPAAPAPRVSRRPAPVAALPLPAPARLSRAARPLPAVRPLPTFTAAAPVIPQPPARAAIPVAAPSLRAALLVVVLAAAVGAAASALFGGNASGQAQAHEAETQARARPAPPELPVTPQRAANSAVFW